MSSYPVVDLLVKRGAIIAILVGLGPVIAGIAAFVAGAHWLFIPGGIVLGVIVYLVMKSYVEVVAIISDMLLPK